MDLLNHRHVEHVCPKTGKQVVLSTDYPEPQKSLNDKISKADLKCGHNCNFEPCPIVAEHNSIY